MSNFTGPLILQEVIPGKLWKTKEPVYYHAFYKGSEYNITIPKDFITDGTTIPPLLRVFLAVWGTYGRASLLHDYLYHLGRTGMLWDISVSNDVLKAYKFWSNPLYLGDMNNFRKFADLEFKTAALALSTNKVLTYIMYYSIRVFGSKAIKRV